MTWVLRHESRRIVPFTFERGSGSEPAASIPPVDNRGHRHPTFGPIVALSSSEETSFVKLIANIPGRHRVGLTVTNTAAVRILHDPPEIDVQGDTLIQLRAFASPTAHTDAVLQVHAGGVSGPIVAKLNIRVYLQMFVIPAVHQVQLFNNHAQGPVPGLGNITGELEVARQIWRPYGIEILDAVTGFNVIRARSNDVNTYHVPAMLPSASVNHILTADPMSGCLNIYVVNDLALGAGTLNGLGISHRWVAAHSAARRGLLLSAQAPADGSSATVAHELGHVLDLWHVGKKNDPHADGSTRALRQLMHPLTPPARPNQWPPGGTARTTTRPRWQDVGWGGNRLGGLVTMKSLPRVLEDHEANTATNSLRQHPL